MSQADMILNALRQGDKLTALDALTRFRCMRLASRISDLRKLGHDIKDRSIKTESGKTVSEYWIEIPSTLFADYEEKSRTKLYGGL